MSVELPDSFIVSFCRNCGNATINGNGFGCGPLCSEPDIIEIEVGPK